MKTLVSLILSTSFFAIGFANATEQAARKPASVKPTIWETRETPKGKACPYQAHRYDEIAYQEGDGGYVCFQCDYVEQWPMLVVTEQTRCNRNIKCSKGKCK